MDKELIGLRIENTLKHIDLAMSNLENISKDAFEKDSMLSRAVSFSIVQIGEQLNRLETIFGKEHPEIKWSMARSMRNVLVHDYVEVDLNRVYDTVKNDLPILKNQLSQLLA